MSIESLNFESENQYSPEVQGTAEDINQLDWEERKANLISEAISTLGEERIRKAIRDMGSKQNEFINKFLEEVLPDPSEISPNEAII